MLLLRVPNWLGDLVMSLRVLAGAARTPGGASFWAGRRMAGLLDVLLPGVEVIDSGTLPVRGRFDRLILLTDSFRSALDGFRSGIPERCGHRGQFRSLMLTRAVPPLRGRTVHHSEEYERLSMSCGLVPADFGADHVAPRGGPHLAFFPGAAYGPAKRWPAFARLAADLHGMTGLPAVMYGGAGEAEALASTAREAGEGSSACAGLPWDDLCGRLSSAVLAVGNDSGGAHLAACLGTPVLAVFGSTSPAWTAPRGRSVRVVASGVPCSPCFRRSCRAGGDEAPCMRAIPYDRVLSGASELLAAREARGS